MPNIITVIQILSSIFLVVTILLQAKGTGLGAAFGGEGGFYRSRRGVEKILLQTTIFLAVVFLLSSIANVIF